MELNELLLKLNQDLVKRQYRDSDILDRLNMIKNYYGAEAVIFKRSNRIRDIYVVGNVTAEDFGNPLYIKNPKKEVSDFEYEYFKTLFINIGNLMDLSHAYNVDSLTKVGSKEALNYLLESKTNFSNVGVAFIDANGLGILNNTYGHEKGDALLRTVGLAIRTNFRLEDAFRKGGDEFLIIAENISKEKFDTKIEGIRNFMQSTKYSVSIGSIYSEKTDDIGILISKADALMYKEKEEYRINNPDKYTVKFI